MSDGPEHTPLPPRTDGIPRSATHDHCRARIAELQAHFADLGKMVTAAQDECRRMTRETAVVMSAHLEEKARAEQAEAEVAELNRVLAVGREEYELAVAEMNRRGEEIARLTGLLCKCCPHDSVNGDVCAACGLHIDWVDDGDHMGHFDLAARYEEHGAPLTDDYKRARGAVTPPPASDPPEDIIRRLRDGDAARHEAEHDA